MPTSLSIGSYEKSPFYLEIFVACNNAIVTIVVTIYLPGPHKCLMTRAGPRYDVLDGDPIPQRKGTIWGENVTAHCEIMGHSTVRCAKRRGTEKFDD